MNEVHASRTTQKITFPSLQQDSNPRTSRHRLHAMADSSPVLALSLSRNATRERVPISLGPESVALRDRERERTGLWQTQVLTHDTWPANCQAEVIK